MLSAVERNVPAVARRARHPYGSEQGRVDYRVRTGTNATMKRVIAIAACGLLVSACSSWVPSFDMSAFKSAPPTEHVRIELEPPGADARTTVGAACRTPCALDLPVNEGTITVALNGYQPQTVPVQIVRSEGRPDEFFMPSSHLTPNPVFVELQPTPPPPPPAKKPGPKKPRVVARMKPPANAPMAAPEAPPPSTGAMPPWPSPR